MKGLWLVGLGLWLCIADAGAAGDVHFSKYEPGKPDPAKAVVLWVSPLGDDAGNGGSVNEPVRTIERAQELVRSATAREPGRQVIVYLGGGEYALKETVEFTERDGGASPEASVYWLGTPR
jgi:hypothetical protein